MSLQPSWSDTNLMYMVPEILGHVLEERDSYILRRPHHAKLRDLIGWGYTLLWSISFYPQLIYMIRHRRAHGLSPDFVVLNVLGFFALTTFNKLQNSSPSIPNLVRLNDVFFSTHALILATITVILAYKYGMGRTVSSAVQIFTKICTVSMFVMLGLLILSSFPLLSKFRSGIFATTLSFTALVKTAISLWKYVPQLILNYRRKSTVGFSIANILLDFSGGVLCLLQLVLDSYAIAGDLHLIFRNPPKLLISLISLIMDLGFIVQHYVLYKDAEDDYLPEGYIPTYHEEDEDNFESTIENQSQVSHSSQV